MEHQYFGIELHPNGSHFVTGPLPIPAMFLRCLLLVLRISEGATEGMILQHLDN